MKKSMILLVLATPLLHAAQELHDFAYYKEKTIEMLPILGIKPTNVSFKEVTSEPTISERISNYHVIFINTTKLNNISTSDALCECALEAKLSSIVEYDLNPGAQFSIMPSILMTLGCWCLAGTLHLKATDTTMLAPSISIKNMYTKLSKFFFIAPCAIAPIGLYFEYNNIRIQTFNKFKLNAEFTIARSFARSAKATTNGLHAHLATTMLYNIKKAHKRKATEEYVQKFQSYSKEIQNLLEVDDEFWQRILNV